MEIRDLPFAATDWSTIDRIEHKGDTGSAFWRTVQCGPVRVRMVEYSPGYLADHWCSRGHVLFVLEGELDTELKDGRKFTLLPGMSYQVASDAEPHRSSLSITNPEGFACRSVPTIRRIGSQQSTGAARGRAASWC